MPEDQTNTENPAPTTSERNSRLSRRSVLVGVAAAGATWAAGSAPAPAEATSHHPRPPRAPYGPVTVFAPPSGTQGWGVKYARVARLPGGDSVARSRAPRLLVAACENLFDPVDYAYPVFSSADDGRSWQRVGSVEDARTGAKPRWQPFLYALPRPFAGLPRGALLCAGNTIPDDFSSTAIEIFASTDAGRTWSFRSRVALGGPPVPNNGDTPVWEPSLLLHAGRLICYYSDQRDPAYGQKLAHQTSTDLRHWGPVVNDQADAVYAKRPGMPTVARLGDGRWILTYEDGNNAEVSFGVAYKIARSPEHFAAATPQLLRTTTGLVPIGSPTVTWCAAGGRRGTIVVSAGENEQLFLNRAGGAADGWTTMASVVPRGYSRQVQAWDEESIMTIGGGPGNDPPPGVNEVQWGLDRVGRRR